MKIFPAFLLALCAAQAAYAESAFTVTLSLDESSLSTDMYRKTGRLFVSPIIKNVSGKDQKITVWSQQGWSWVSDNDAVTPGTEAAQNFPFTYTLKPGGEYNAGVELFADARKKRPITFRLGFYPSAQSPVSSQSGFLSAHGSEVIWSNPVTLKQ